MRGKRLAAVVLAVTVLMLWLLIPAVAREDQGCMRSVEWCR